MELHKNVSVDGQMGSQPGMGAGSSPSNGTVLGLNGDSIGASGSKPISQLIGGSRAKAAAVGELALAGLNKSVGTGSGMLLAKSAKVVRKFAPY